MAKLPSTLLILLLALSASGATYFVDFVGGSDAANGTSSATPWQHCHGDSAATGTAASTAFAAGDTVIFKGGVNYSNTVSISTSGTRASPITFDGNSAGTFGTGQAIMNGHNASVANGTIGMVGFNCAVSFGFRSVSALQYSNLVFKNFQFTRYGGHGSDNPANITWTCASLPSTVYGTPIYLSGCDGVVISSCLFTNCGDWTNAPNMNASFFSGTGILCDYYNQNITITNNEITRVGHAGMQFFPEQPKDWCTNIFIGNNNIHDWLQWGIIFTPGSGATNCIVNAITMTNNTIHDMNQLSQSGWLGCAGAWPHQDGIFFFLGYSPTPTFGATLGTTNSPVVIANNNFYNNAISTNNGGTACIYVSGYGGRLLIYNNIFNNVLNQGEGAIYLNGAFDLVNNQCTLNDYEILNNSFYDQTFGVYMGSTSQANALTNGSVVIKNNIFKHDLNSNFAMPVAFGADAWSKPKDLDYNDYVTVRVDQEIATYWNGAQTAATVAQLQSALGFETHGFYGDPKYQDISNGLGLNSSLNNFHLQASSPAIGTGQTLSSLFTTDNAGSTRTVPWSMGAFIASSDPSITIQPQSQTVSVGSTATFSVTASTASPPLTYQWTKNGSNIASATQSTYTTPATSCPDNGSLFAVVVANALSSSVTSINATLTVTGCQGTVTNYASQIGTANIGAARF